MKQQPLNITIRLRNNKVIMRLKPDSYHLAQLEWWEQTAFLATTAHTNRSHKETLVPFKALKTNTTPPVQCPAGGGNKSVGECVCVCAPLQPTVWGVQGRRRPNEISNACLCSTVLHQYYSVTQLYSQSCLTIWSRCMCYEHNFSGDKLMHRPNLQ